MPDVDDLRSRVTRTVYRRLADRSFRERLTATSPSGDQPIIVSLPADPMRDLLHRLAVVGGSGNVVMPKVNGFVVVAIQDEPNDGNVTDDNAPALTPDCTVGVFVARVLADGGGVYRFRVEDGSRSTENGRAELVALGC